MTPVLQNPFVEVVIPSASKAAAPMPHAPAEGAAATDLLEISFAELVKRGFDEEGFLNDLEPLPAFLIDPRQQYLQAADLIPVLAVLAGERP
jgi:hypothetical protein